MLVPSQISAPASRSRRPALALQLIALAIAWGVLAFGAVYPWAFWPLLAAFPIVSGLAFTAEAPGIPRAVTSIGFHISLALLVSAAAAQLVPLPMRVVGILSPHAPSALAALYPAVAAGLVGSHAVSLNPRSTVVGLFMLASFAFLVVALTRLLSIRGPRGIALTVTIVATVAAVSGIVQQGLSSRLIYGFWKPLYGTDPFGPFVNRNHFAGLMLMALPVTLGLVSAVITHGITETARTFRHRLLWLASPQASQAVLLCTACVVMALALVLTMSRSGIAAVTLTLAATTALLLRSREPSARRRIGIAFITIMAAGVFGWVGPDRVVGRFEEANWSEFNNRKGAWLDALDIARHFPLTGTGLNTYGTATILYQRHDLAQHYQEAHNDYLQLAAEGGLLLLLPTATCVVFFVRDVSQRFREETNRTSYWIRAGAVSGLLAIGLQETVDFSLQMPGNALTFVVLCALALHRTTAPRPAPRKAKAVVAG